MNGLFRKKCLAILIMATFNSSADIIFTGDTKKTNDNNSLTSYTGIIYIGKTDTDGSPEAPTGTLLVNSGSQMTGDNSLYIGSSSGTSGLVTLSDAGTSLTLDKNIFVSSAGDSYGRLNILNGASLTTSSSGSGAGSIGYMGNASGLVNISGQGSVWNSNGALNVGESGSGILNIYQNASVNSTEFWVGRYANSLGVVNIDNGVLASSSYTVIGNNGTGVMNVTNGSQVTNTFTTLGNINGKGELHLSGPGTVYSSLDHIHVGSNTLGSGVVTVSKGATLNTSLSGSSTIGESLELGRLSENTTGSVIVTGSNSVINTNGGRTIIGNKGVGILTLQENGELRTEDIILAAEAGAIGMLNIGAVSDKAATVAGYIAPATNINFGEGKAILNFNHLNNGYIFENLILGTGAVEVNSGETILTAQNSWSGTANLNAGTLKAGAINTFSHNATYNIADGALLDLNGFNQTISTVSNSGTINLSDGQPGTVLTINGDYIGEGGLINLGTRLDDDSSLTDKVIITGNTSGGSKVAIANLGGTGASTLNGIEIISVGGASDGDFVQQGRIVAGAWEYKLARGLDANSANWYLSSTFVETQPDNSGEGNSGNEINALRPEAGAYAANAYAADTMFNTTLSDRLGETEYTDMMTAERKLTSLWMKNTGGHSRINDSTGQLKTKSNRYVLMLGGDFATAFTKGGGAFRFGALAGYGYNHSNTQSSLSRYHAKGSVNGYTAGLYATWYADGYSEQGAYIDGVLQHSWFNNRVNGQLLDEEKYSSKGFSASLESGYVLPMSNDAQSVAWFVQPQAKILWSGIKSKDLIEVNGTAVKTEGDNNLTTSLGLKVFIKGHSTIDNQKARNFKPFAETNWLHNMHNRGVVMDGVSVNQSGTRDVGELKMGVEGRMSPELNITGFVNQQIGDEGYSDTSAVIGFKYSF